MLFGARVQKAFIRVDGSEESDAAQAALGILIGKPDLTKFEVDVIIRESTNLGNIVTENPLEDGTSIFDHVTNKPQTLDIEFIITDTPIGTLSFLGGTFSKKGRSSEEFIRQRERENNSLPPSVVDDIWRNYFAYINLIKSKNEKRNI